MMHNDELICDKIIEGIDYLSIGRYSEALSCFNAVLEIDDGNLAALNNKAISLNGLNKFEDAILIFDKILMLDSNFIFSLIGKGESLFKLGYYDFALLYFDRALKIENDNDVALFNKAKIYEKYNQFHEALKCLDQVKNISGNLLFKQDIYSKILKNSKKDLFNQRVAFIKKIDGHINLNAFEDVYLICDDALKFDEDSLYFLFNKAYSSYRLNKFNESMQIIERILKIDFMNVDALDIKSRIHIKRKEYDDALICLDDIKNFGGYVDSSLYKDVGLKLEKVEDKSNKIKSFIFKGNDLILHDDFDGALENYENAIRLNHSSIIALNNKAYVYYLLEDYSAALRAFNSVLMIDENYIYSLIGKSYSLYYLKRYEDSLKCYEKALEIDDSLVNQDYIDLLNDKIKSKNG